MQSLRSYLKETGAIKSRDKQVIQLAKQAHNMQWKKEYNKTYWTKYRWIKVRLTKEQEDMLEKHLQKFNKKLNADNLLLLAIQGIPGQVKIYDSKQVSDWTKTANSIGNLLNQWIVIARKTDNIKAEEIIQIKSMLTDWRDRVANELKQNQATKKEGTTSN